ncbi:MAG: diguanylate cyclase response regulator [Rhodobacteraceae bacterium]|nr:diguanylate cyclase response regulator [Paracoccaceae bacterium]
MQARLLILDAVSTNRIVLNALLEPSCYTIDQAASIAEGMAHVRTARPDLVLTAWSLPDGSAMDLRAALDGADRDRDIPVLAIARPGESTDRRAALQAGLTDVLFHPLDESMLHARLRSILRRRPPSSAFDLPTDSFVAPPVAEPAGFAEPRAGFTVADATSTADDSRHDNGPGIRKTTAPAPVLDRDRVVVLAEDPETALAWGQRLGTRLDRPVAGYALAQRQAVFGAAAPPDALVLALDPARPAPAMRLLADLRAGTSTRHVAVIVLLMTPNPQAAAHALDLGADDVMTGPFESCELALRVQAQLRRKQLSDRLRNTVRDGLRAALVDPMTGLYNRRYAIPYLAHTVRQSSRTGKGFAVMMADLDHFKRINDRHGHLAGDTVLIEAAARLRAALDRPDMVARIGGEEFLIVLGDADDTRARTMADTLRRAINGRPFHILPAGRCVTVTMSIGVALCPPAHERDGYGFPDDPDEPQIMAILNRADQALYDSKHAGRDKVTMVGAAA